MGTNSAKAEAGWLGEVIEVIIAALGSERELIGEESADLLYHPVALWAKASSAPADVSRELASQERAPRGLPKRPRATRSQVAVERPFLYPRVGGGPDFRTGPSLEQDDARQRPFAPYRHGRSHRRKGTPCNRPVARGINAEAMRVRAEGVAPAHQHLCPRLPQRARRPKDP